jgi:branched-chain amino acid transport system ATP-binding protein
LLEVRNLDAFYGAMQVLHGVNLAVGAGEIVGLVGANAAGKSSLMFTLAGLRTTHRGAVLLDGDDISGLSPWERPSRGLVLVPERRRLFPFMSVLENLEVGAYASARPRGNHLRKCSRCCPCLPNDAARLRAR